MFPPIFYRCSVNFSLSTEALLWHKDCYTLLCLSTEALLWHKDCYTVLSLSAEALLWHKDGYTVLSLSTKALLWHKDCCTVLSLSTKALLWHNDCYTVLSLSTEALLWHKDCYSLQSFTPCNASCNKHIIFVQEIVQSLLILYYIILYKWILLTITSISITFFYPLISKYAVMRPLFWIRLESLCWYALLSAALNSAAYNACRYINDSVSAFLFFNMLQVLADWADCVTVAVSNSWLFVIRCYSFSWLLFVIRSCS